MRASIQNIKWQKVAVMATLAITLQSCFVAKDYEQPEIVDEENFRTDNIPQDSLTMADVSWRDMFTDPVLQEYIEEGLQNNIDIRVALQQIVSAEAYLKQGKAGYFPSVTVNPTYTHQELSSNSQFGNFFSSLNQYELSADSTIDSPLLLRWIANSTIKIAFLASKPTNIIKAI